MWLITIGPLISSKCHFLGSHKYFGVQDPNGLVIIIPKGHCQLLIWKRKYFYKNTGPKAERTLAIVSLRLAIARQPRSGPRYSELNPCCSEDAFCVPLDLFQVVPPAHPHELLHFPFHSTCTPTWTSYTLFTNFKPSTNHMSSFSTPTCTSSFKPPFQLPPVHNLTSHPP